MNIKLNQYGPILTGREFGQRVMKELEAKLVSPVSLDFEGTISLGSSFGDEIVPVIAKIQGGKIEVRNPNPAVWTCLTQLAQDHKIEVTKQ